MPVDFLSLLNNPVPYTAPLRAARRRKQPEDDLTLEEQDALRSSIAAKTVGGLAYVGELLDKPGRAVRGIASGLSGGDWGGGLLNLIPFSDTLGLTPPEEQVTGRDLLETWGMEENTPGLDFGDVAGVGAEILLDPTTYLSLGAGALTKAGKFAKSAGVLDDFIKTSRVAGKGPRATKMGTSIGDLMQTPEYAQKLTNTALDQGLSAADLAAMQSEKLGGLVGIGLPFRDPSIVLGKGGPVAEKIAGALDTAGHALRYGKIPGTDYSPGAHAGALFSTATKGVMEPTTQKYAQEATQATINNESPIRSAVARAAMNVRKWQSTLPVKATDKDLNILLRKIFEGVESAPTPEIADDVARIWKFDDDQLNAYQMVGGKLSPLVDQYVQHITRLATGMPPRDAANAAHKFALAEGSDIAREEYLKNIPEGTGKIVEVMSDPEIQAIADATGDVKAVARRLRSKYGADLPPTYMGEGTRVEYVLDRNTGLPKIDPQTGKPETIKTTVAKPRNRYIKMASTIVNHPLATKAGLFGNDPLVDFQTAAIRREEAIQNGRMIGKIIAENAKDVARPSRDEWMTVKELYGKLNFSSGIEGLDDAGIQQLSAQLNGPNAAGGLWEVARQRSAKAPPGRNARLLGPAMVVPERRWLDQVIPRQMGESLVRMHEAYARPDAANAILKAIDSFNALFKVGVLTAPARYVRDLTSGTYQNWQSGLIDLKNLPRALKNAGQAIYGKTITGAESIPIVRNLLKARGIQVTPESATDVIKELAYTYGLVGHGPATQVGMHAGLPITQQLDTILEHIPGEIPYSLKKAGRTLIGKEPGISPWKFWEVRGVVDAKGIPRRETTFGGAAAGNIIGFGTDSLNRLSPFIEGLRKGIDPSELASRIRAAQVDYGPKAITKTERELFARAMPFYKFTKGAVPYTLRQLWEKPGGKLAQTIRVLGSGRDPNEIVPDYVAETSSFRIPEGFPLIGPEPGGDPRFVTGLGLMFEDMLGFVGGGAQGALTEGLSRMTPLAKGPLEHAAGESFFQKGPEGGRELTDMDPALGRLMANVVGSEDPVPTPGWLEELLINSPASRVLTTARTLTDRRKNIPAKMLNTLTGVKSTDVPEKTSDAILRDKTKALMDEMGGIAFESVYFPEDMKAKMSPEKRLQAERLEALRDYISKRAKERAKERQRKSIPVGAGSL